MNYEQEIEEIIARNKRVENDKAWETSLTRRGFIAGITYSIAVIFMNHIGVENVFLSALVPTGGYILSTLSLQFLKQKWLASRS